MSIELNAPIRGDGVYTGSMATGLRFCGFDPQDPSYVKKRAFKPGLSLLLGKDLGQETFRFWILVFIFKRGLSTRFLALL